MIANYHTHTPRCNHAEGAERDYIERALEGGFRELGFSDHTPYLFDVPGYYSRVSGTSVANGEIPSRRLRKGGDSFPL